MEIQKEFGSFQITSGHLQMEHYNQPPKALIEVPATPLSDTISTDLKKRGFKFVGSTVVYAYLQATGLINDHVSDVGKKSVNNGVVFSDFSKHINRIKRTPISFDYKSFKPEYLN
jgi:3-methyladenine DNA glycosylase Tag